MTSSEPAPGRQVLANAWRPDRGDVVVAVFALAMLSTLAIQVGYRLTTAPHPWLSGDWLISYAGGFVRRGAFGSLLLATGLNALWIERMLMFVQFSCYTLVFLTAFRLLLRQEDRSVWALALLSPAFLLSGALDAAGTHRKEILGLALLAGLIHSSHANSRIRIGGAVGISFVLGFYVLAVLSHELNALLAPSILVAAGWATDRAERRWPRVVLRLGIPLIAVGGIVSALVGRGSARLAAEACRAVTERGYPETVCAGAIDALGQSLSLGVRWYDWVFPPLVVLAAVPLALIPWVRSNLVVVGVQTAAVMSLSLVAIDHGRFAITTVICLTLLALEGSTRGARPPVDVPLPLAFAFAITWRFWHSVGEGTMSGVPIYDAVLSRLVSG